jgi:hypothetical protein
VHFIISKNPFRERERKGERELPGFFAFFYFEREGLKIYQRVYSSVADLDPVGSGPFWSDPDPGLNTRPNINSFGVF